MKRVNGAMKYRTADHLVVINGVRVRSVIANECARIDEARTVTNID